MTVAIEIPEAEAETLRQKFGDLSRLALETLAVEGYKRNALSEYQVRKLLGHASRMETDAFLKAHEAWLPLTVADVAGEVKEARRRLAL